MEKAYLTLEECYNARTEHLARIFKRFLLFSRVFRFSKFIDTALHKHRENNSTKMSAEGSNRLVVRLSLSAFFLVVTLRFRDLFTMPVNADHHRRFRSSI
jgi:hypothetical protein